MKSLGGFRPSWKVWAVGGLLIALSLLTMQSYSLRALLAAELLFALFLLLLTVFGAVLYYAGEAIEMITGAIETAMRAVALWAQRGYRDLEEISRRWISSARSLHAHK